MVKSDTQFSYQRIFLVTEIILGLILLLCSENTIPRIGHGKK